MPLRGASDAALPFFHVLGFVTRRDAIFNVTAGILQLQSQEAELSAEHYRTKEQLAELASDEEALRKLCKTAGGRKGQKQLEAVQAKLQKFGSGPFGALESPTAAGLLEEFVEQRTMLQAVNDSCVTGLAEVSSSARRLEDDYRRLLEMKRPASVVAASGATPAGPGGRAAQIAYRLLSEPALRNQYLLEDDHQAFLRSEACPEWARQVNLCRDDDDWAVDDFPFWKAEADDWTAGDVPFWKRSKDKRVRSCPAETPALPPPPGKEGPSGPRQEPDAGLGWLSGARPGEALFDFSEDEAEGGDPDGSHVCSAGKTGRSGYLWQRCTQATLSPDEGEVASSQAGPSCASLPATAALEGPAAVKSSGREAKAPRDSGFRGPGEEQAWAKKTTTASRDTGAGGPAAEQASAKSTTASRDTGVGELAAAETSGKAAASSRDVGVGMYTIGKAASASRDLGTGGQAMTQASGKAAAASWGTGTGVAAAAQTSGNSAPASRDIGTFATKQTSGKAASASCDTGAAAMTQTSGKAASAACDTGAAAKTQTSGKAASAARDTGTAATAQTSEKAASAPRDFGTAAKTQNSGKAASASRVIGTGGPAAGTEGLATAQTSDKAAPASRGTGTASNVPTQQAEAAPPSCGDVAKANQSRELPPAPPGPPPHTQDTGSTCGRAGKAAAAAAPLGGGAQLSPIRAAAGGGERPATPKAPSPPPLQQQDLFCQLCGVSARPWMIACPSCRCWRTDLRGAAELAEAYVEDCPPEFVCPISMQLMRRPCTTSDGRLYDWASVEEWLAKHNTSPLTNVPVTKELTDEPGVSSRIERWLESLAGWSSETPCSQRESPFVWQAGSVPPEDDWSLTETFGVEGASARSPSAAAKSTPPPRAMALADTSDDEDEDWGKWLASSA